MDSTVVTEWDLVCDVQYQVALVGSIYMCGLLFGSFIFGRASDKLGRRPALAAAVLTSVTAGLGGAFVDSYAWYCVTRFFTGVGSQGCVVVGFVLTTELAGKRTVSFVGIFNEVYFALGEALVSIVGIWVKDWRDFQVRPASKPDHLGRL